ncbi:hypothetical protein BGZ82_008553 [Podila clonocystis]|nr:hypothetical protein BGZ82_008553 [Podila clonocystis]
MPSIRSIALAISVALFSASALALPTTHNCHEPNVHAMGETYEQAASLCRDLVKDTNVGTFMTVMNGEKGAQLEGYPFGSMDYYVDDCQNSGTPLMLLSHLQINMHNIKSNNKASLAVRKLPKEGERGNPMMDRRVTLIGHLVPVEKSRHAEVEACFVAGHPDAKWWLPGSGFHDFAWYTLEVESLYHVGGFGGIHHIGWIDVDTYKNAVTSSSAPAVESRFRIQY